MNPKELKWGFAVFVMISIVFSGIIILDDKEDINGMQTGEDKIVRYKDASYIFKDGYWSIKSSSVENIPVSTSKGQEALTQLYNERNPNDKVDIDVVGLYNEGIVKTESNDDILGNNEKAENVDDLFSDTDMYDESSLDDISDDGEIIDTKNEYTPKKEFDIGGESYSRTGEGTYYHEKSGADITVNDDGSVDVVYTDGDRETYGKDSDIAKQFNKNEHGSEVETSTRSVSTDGLETTPEVTLPDTFTQKIVDAAAASGGWVDFIGGGAFTNSFATIGAFFGERDHGIDFSSVFSIDSWAQGICAVKNLNKDGSRSFITSPSGKTVMHMEGEQVEIDPCFGMTGEGCDKYYGYKISGEIRALEVKIDVDIILKGDNVEDFNLYEGTVNVPKGEYLSLAGVNMFYFESYNDYDEICMEFENAEEIQYAIGRVMGTHSNPIDKVCQDIVEAYERDYQKFEDEDNKATKGPQSPSAPPGPTGPNSGVGDTSNMPGPSGGVPDDDEITPQAPQEETKAPGPTTSVDDNGN